MLPNLISLNLLAVLLTTGISKNAPVREEVRYNLLIRDKVVGELVAVREVKNGQEVYRNITDVEANLLKKFNIKFDLTSVFTEGELHRCHSKTVVNGSLHKETLITRKGNAYHVNINGDKSRVDHRITYASSMLILREPKGLNLCFSEQDGEFHPLEYKGNGYYKKQNPSGGINDYSYRDGKLAYAKVSTGWFSFEIKEKKAN